MPRRGAAPDAAMIAAGRAAMARAHAPYSRFKVGAVVRSAEGRLYAGCNVENSSYPEGICAETAAIAAMVMAGEARIVEVLVMGKGKAPIAPCGGCRQRLREFAGDDLRVHMCGSTGSVKTATLGALLPQSFGPNHLPKRRGTR